MHPISQQTIIPNLKDLRSEGWGETFAHKDFSKIKSIFRAAIEIFLSYTSITTLSTFVGAGLGDLEILGASAFIVLAMPEVAYILTAFALAILAVTWLPELLAPLPAQILVPSIINPISQGFGPGIVI